MRWLVSGLAVIAFVVWKRWWLVLDWLVEDAHRRSYKYLIAQTPRPSSAPTPTNGRASDKATGTSAGERSG